MMMTNASNPSWSIALSGPTPWLGWFLLVGPGQMACGMRLLVRSDGIWSFSEVEEAYRLYLDLQTAQIFAGGIF